MPQMSDMCHLGKTRMNPIEPIWIADTYPNVMGQVLFLLQL